MHILEIKEPIMDFRNLPYFTIILALSFMISSLSPFISSQLAENFYEDTCPDVESIVRDFVWMAAIKEKRMASSLLRLHFHDCFVNGCDGSVLLDDTSTFEGEKNAFGNHNSLKGFWVIDKIKNVLEEACPLTVSCADILALAARDSVSLTGGSYWAVPLGRRDGMTASQEAANDQLPSPFEPLENITAKFTSRGLDLQDVVVLSGGHSIGFAKCLTISERLFNFRGSGKPDPVLESSLLKSLQSTCPNEKSNNKLVSLDATVDIFDNEYFKNVMNRQGLLESDHALMGDRDAASKVKYYSTNPDDFSNDFATSMVKMGNIGVLTGDDGEIRENCRYVN